MGGGGGRGEKNDETPFFWKIFKIIFIYIGFDENRREQRYSASIYNSVFYTLKRNKNFMEDNFNEPYGC